MKIASESSSATDVENLKFNQIGHLQGKIIKHLNNQYDKKRTAHGAGITKLNNVFKAHKKFQ